MRHEKLEMNTSTAPGSYPWTIIPVETHSAYMAALEATSAHQNITIFARFLAGQSGSRYQGRLIETNTITLLLWNVSGAQAWDRRISY